MNVLLIHIYVLANVAGVYVKDGAIELNLTISINNIYWFHSEKMNLCILYVLYMYRTDSITNL